MNCFFTCSEEGVAVDEGGEVVPSGRVAKPLEIFDDGVGVILGLRGTGKGAELDDVEVLAVDVDEDIFPVEVRLSQ